MKPQLPQLRRRMRPALTGSCRIERVDGYTMDPDNGQQVPNLVVIHTGPCLLLPQGTTTPTEGLSAGWHFVLSDYQLLLPADVPEVRPGDRVIMLASWGDTSLVGKKLVVKSSVLDEWQVFRTLLCTRVE